MKTIKKVLHSYERDETVSVTCDICHVIHKGDDWDSGAYGVAETEIRMKTGSSYPEGGSGQETTFDICPKCFAEKLVPFMVSLGAAPAVVDWDTYG